MTPEFTLHEETMKSAVTVRVEILRHRCCDKFIASSRLSHRDQLEGLQLSLEPHSAACRKLVVQRDNSPLSGRTWTRAGET